MLRILPWARAISPLPAHHPARSFLGAGAAAPIDTASTLRFDRCRPALPGGADQNTAVRLDGTTAGGLPTPAIEVAAGLLLAAGLPRDAGNPRAHEDSHRERHKEKSYGSSSNP